ncbi:MAG: hypothetical protein WC748_08115 [Legionellales bacterium]|jgi:hypothetical protein
MSITDALIIYLDAAQESLSKNDWSQVYEMIVVLEDYKLTIRDSVRLMNKFIPLLLSLIKYFVEKEHFDDALKLLKIWDFLFTVTHWPQINNHAELLRQKNNYLGDAQNGAGSTHVKFSPRNSPSRTLRHTFIDQQKKALESYFSNALDTENIKRINSVVVLVEYVIVKEYLIKNCLKNVNNTAELDKHFNLLRQLAQRLHYTDQPKLAWNLYSDLYQLTPLTLTTEPLRIQLLTALASTKYPYSSAEVISEFKWKKWHDTYTQIKNDFLTDVNNKNIKSKQTDFVFKQRDLIKLIIENACELISPPPCEFSIVLTGSYANGLAGVQSDLEYYFVLESELESENWRDTLNDPTKAHEHYFQKIVDLIDVSITTLGSNHFSLDNSGRLFGTINELMTVIQTGEYTAVHSLMFGHFIYGSESLWEQYHNNLSELLKINHIDRAKYLIQAHDFERIMVNNVPVAGIVTSSVAMKVKKEYIAPLYYWIDDTTLLHYSDAHLHSDFYVGKLNRLRVTGFLFDEFCTLIADSMNQLQVIRNTSSAVNFTAEQAEFLEKLKQYLLLPLYLLLKDQKDRKIVNIEKLIEILQTALNAPVPNAILSVKVHTIIHSLAFWVCQKGDPLLYMSVYQSFCQDKLTTEYNQVIRKLFYQILLKFKAGSVDHCFTIPEDCKRIMDNILPRLYTFPMANGWSIASAKADKRFAKNLNEFLASPQEPDTLDSNLRPLYLTTAAYDSDRNVAVTTQWALKSNVISQLQSAAVKSKFRFKSFDDIPNTVRGRHLVLPVKSTSPRVPRFWFKILPEQSSVEYQISRLMQRLIGPGFCVETKIAKISRGDGQPDMAVQLSVDMGEMSLNKRDTWDEGLVDKITFASFFAHFLRVLITMPEDDKESDYFLTERSDGKYDLKRIDMERGWFDPTTPKKKYFGLMDDIPTLHVKSILLCLSQMTKALELDDPIVLQFLAIDSHAMLEKWLEEMRAEHACYKEIFDVNSFRAHYPANPGDDSFKELFGTDEWTKFFPKNEPESCLLTVPLSAEIIQILSERINLLQSILQVHRRENLQITPIELLKQIIPLYPNGGQGFLENYYEPALECRTSEDIMKRYGTLSKLNERALHMFNVNSLQKLKATVIPLARFWAVTDQYYLITKKGASISPENLRSTSSPTAVIVYTQGEALAIHQGTHPSLGYHSARVQLENLTQANGEGIINRLLKNAPVVGLNISEEINNFNRLSIRYRHILIKREYDNILANDLGSYYGHNTSDGLKRIHVIILKLMAGVNFTDLDLRKFSSSLTNELLTNILQNSFAGQHLRTLNLSNCSLLRNDIVPIIAQYAPYLNQLVLQSTAISKIEAVVFPKLKSLDISNSVNLRSIDFSGKKMTLLTALGCARLDYLWIKDVQDVTARAVVDGTRLKGMQTWRRLLYLPHQASLSSIPSSFSDLPSVVRNMLIDVISAGNTENSLNLSMHHLDDNHTKTIAAILSHENCRINTLDLSSNGIGEEGAKAIKRSLLKKLQNWADVIATPLPVITTLYFSGNSISQSSLDSLHALITLNKILVMMRRGGPVVVNFPYLSLDAARILKQILIDNNQIVAVNIQQTDGGARTIQLCDDIQSLVAINKILPNLLDPANQTNAVHLSGEKIGQSALKKLIDIGFNQPHSRVTSLNLACNRLGDSGVKELVIWLKNRDCKLEEVNLGLNQIGNRGAMMLAAALYDPNCKLGEINLWGNMLGDLAAESLVNYFHNEKRAIVIDLNRNKITAEKFDELKRIGDGNIVDDIGVESGAIPKLAFENFILKAFVQESIPEISAYLAQYTSILAAQTDAVQLRENFLLWMFNTIFATTDPNLNHKHFYWLLSCKPGRSLLNDWLLAPGAQHAILRQKIINYIQAPSWHANNNYPLHQAACNEDEDCFLLLVKLGAPVDIKNTTTPPMYAFEMALAQNKARAFVSYMEYCYNNAVMTAPSTSSSTALVLSSTASVGLTPIVITGNNAQIDRGIVRNLPETVQWNRRDYGPFIVFAIELRKLLGRNHIDFTSLSDLFRAGNFKAYLYFEHLTLLDPGLQPNLHTTTNSLNELFRITDEATGNTYLHYLTDAWLAEPVDSYERVLMLSSIKWIIDVYDKNQELLHLKNHRGETPIRNQHLDEGLWRDLSTDTLYQGNLVRGPLRFIFELKHTIAVYRNSTAYRFYKDIEDEFFRNFDGILTIEEGMLRDAPSTYNEENLVNALLKYCNNQKFQRICPGHRLWDELENLINQVHAGKVEHYQVPVLRTPISPNGSSRASNITVRHLRVEEEQLKTQTISSAAAVNAAKAKSDTGSSSSTPSSISPTLLFSNALVTSLEFGSDLEQINTRLGKRSGVAAKVFALIKEEKGPWKLYCKEGAKTFVSIPTIDINGLDVKLSSFQTIEDINTTIKDELKKIILEWNDKLLDNEREYTHKAK